MFSMKSETSGSFCQTNTITIVILMLVKISTVHARMKICSF